MAESADQERERLLRQLRELFRKDDVNIDGRKRRLASLTLGELRELAVGMDGPGD